MGSKKTGPFTQCRKCGKEDVNRDVTIGHIIDRHRTATMFWLCDDCAEAVKEFCNYRDQN